MTAGQIAQALNRALIPHIGVSVGDAVDRSTWCIDYAPSATTEQRAAGEQIRLTWSPETDPTWSDYINAAEAQVHIDEQKAIKAAVLCALRGRLGRQPTAPEIAAERTRFITIYKAL